MQLIKFCLSYNKFLGSVYGLSNDNGDVLWSLNLGNNVVPFRDQLGQPKMPLFIQRSTTYYQYPSQAAVVFNTKVISIFSTRFNIESYFRGQMKVKLPSSIRLLESL